MATRPPLVCVVMTLAVLASTANADDPAQKPRPLPTTKSVGWRNMPWKYRGPWLPEGTRFNLIHSPAVQKELQLDEAHQEKIFKGRLTPIADEIAQLRFNIVRKWAAERDAELREAGIVRVNDLEQKLDRELAKQLTADQRRRLDEIALQQGGPIVLTTPEMMHRLGVGEPQIQMIRFALAESQAKLKADESERLGPAPAVPEFGNKLTPQQRVQLQALADRSKAMKTLTHNNENNTSKALQRILTRRQKVRFDKMLGEPFDLSRLTHDYDIQQAKRPSADHPPPGRDKPPEKPPA